MIALPTMDPASPARHRPARPGAGHGLGPGKGALGIPRRVTGARDLSALSCDSSCRPDPQPLRWCRVPSPRRREPDGTGGSHLGKARSPGASPAAGSRFDARWGA